MHLRLRNDSPSFHPVHPLIRVFGPRVLHHAKGRGPSLRTKPEALLRLIRQRWSIENEWHWPRDTQLHEDAHRYANRNGAPLFAFLRTVVMNLLRNGGYRSVHAGQQELSHNIRGMLALGGVAASTG